MLVITVPRHVVNGMNFFLSFHLTHHTPSEFIVRPSLFCLFILHYRTLDFMHTYLFFDLSYCQKWFKTIPCQVFIGLCQLANNSLDHVGPLFLSRRGAAPFQAYAQDERNFANVKFKVVAHGS